MTKLSEVEVEEIRERAENALNLICECLHINNISVAAGLLALSKIQAMQLAEFDNDAVVDKYFKAIKQDVTLAKAALKKMEVKND